MQGVLWVALAGMGTVSMPEASASVRAEPAESEAPVDDEQLDDSYKATAQQLFEEGRELMAQGRTEEACRDFAESQRLDPALGTRFNLAECYEALGKLASAWVHYVGVADEAGRLAQMERAQFARARADALEPRLARMSIEVERWVEGMSITRNGIKVGSAQWTKAIPVDRGEYTIEATAPGYVPREQRVAVPEDGVVVSVVVPALVAEPSTPPPPESVVEAHPPEPTPKPRVDSDRDPGRSRLALAGIIIGGLGVANLAVGGAFGVVATRRKDAADQRCPEPTRCFADGAQLLDDARTAGTISTVTLVAGGVLAVTGVILLAVSPRVRARRTAAMRWSRMRVGWALR